MWHLGHPQPGRLIKSEPKSKGGKFHHGYDVNDRVILTEFYSGDDHFTENYVEYFDDRTEETYYDDPIGLVHSSSALDKVCVNVGTLFLSAGAPIAFLSYANRGQSVDVYECDRGQIVRFWMAHQNDPGQEGMQQPTVIRGTVVYEAGSVERIELEHEGGASEAIYKDGRRGLLAIVEDVQPRPGSPANPAITARLAKKEFLLRVEKAGNNLTTLTPEGGVEIMLAFYRDERIKGCSLREDGDMLLFQWGTQAPAEGQRTFYIDITRQLTLTNKADGVMRQLALTFHFPMQESLQALSESNRWCTAPHELDEFQTFIRDSTAWRAVASLKPAKITLSFYEV